MKRRDFIKVSSAAGIAGLVGPGYSAMANSALSKADGFDLHPFIKEHPEAVFINLTSVKEKTDNQPIYDAAYKLADEMFVKTTKGKGFPNSTKVNTKPNWTCNGRRNSDPESKLGITTDLNFIEGYMNGVKNTGPQDFYLRECACPQNWEANGFTAMAERNNFDLTNLSSKDYWDLEEDDIVWKEVEDGVVFKKIGFMAPMNEPDTFLINIAKFKTHQMGVTGAIKNLQGICGRKFHMFCGGHFDIFRTYDKRYHQFFQPDYMARIVELHDRHMKEGIPRWDTLMDRPPHGGGAFSGKDPSKVDRSAAYAARHIAKNIVAAGISDEILVQISYAIGVVEPIGVFVNTYGKSKVDLSDGEIARKIEEVYDLRPAAIEQGLKLRNPIYLETASYGHMGRTPQLVKKTFDSQYWDTKTIEVELFTWEKLDYVDTFKKAFSVS